LKRAITFRFCIQSFGLLKRAITFRFCIQSLVCISLLSDVCHMPPPAEYKSWCFSLRSFIQSPVNYSFLCPIIILSTMFSITPSLFLPLLYDSLKFSSA
jgi:hypothetical protein